MSKSTNNNKLKVKIVVAYGLQLKCADVDRDVPEVLGRTIDLSGLPASRRIIHDGDFDDIKR